MCCTLHCTLHARTSESSSFVILIIIGTFFVLENDSNSKIYACRKLDFVNKISEFSRKFRLRDGPQKTEYKFSKIFKLCDTHTGYHIEEYNMALAPTRG